MGEPREQPAMELKPPKAEQWVLGHRAPDWLRRMWGEAIRDVPKRTVSEPSRLQRIAYL
jgi:hypothetical protein